MAFKEYLMIPGPTPLPEEIMAAMARQMVGHRGPVFSKIFKEVEEGVKWAHQTKNDVLFVTGSGTAGMEASIANMLSQGDKVIVANIGNFGDRFVKICKAYSLNVVDLKFERGKPADPKEVDKALSENKDTKALLFQQNETSTATINDVEALAKVAQKHNVLTIVDAISGLLTIPLPSDEWDLDVVISGSQKAFMVPPGLAMVSVSPRAWKAYESSKLPKHYFDFGALKKFAEKGQTYTTPPETLFFAMEAGLKILRKEGFENILARHEKNMRAVRAATRACGMKLFVEDEKYASRAVTAIFPPSGIDAEKIRSEMRARFGVELAPGQGDLKGKLFRIGHLGYVDKLDIIAAFSGIELLLKEFGSKVELGKGVTAAIKELS